MLRTRMKSELPSTATGSSFLPRHQVAMLEQIYEFQILVRRNETWTDAATCLDAALLLTRFLANLDVPASDDSATDEPTGSVRISQIVSGLIDIALKSTVEQGAPNSA